MFSEDSRLVYSNVGKLSHSPKGLFWAIKGSTFFIDWHLIKLHNKSIKNMIIFENFA